MKKILLTLAAITLLTACAVADVQRNLTIFNNLYKELATFYVDSLDADRAIRTAIDAMLAEIDPYTEYIAEEDMEQFERQTTGEYGGIGSYIQLQPGKGVIISGPADGSPAMRAGLRHGDLIVAIDADTVLTSPVDEVSRRLRGIAGTDVNLLIHRPYPRQGEDSVQHVTVTRAKIYDPAVTYYGLQPDGVGYIYLSSFTEKAHEEVLDAINDMKAQGMTSLILDLKGNGGGLLESAVNILGYFLPAGTEVLTTRGRDANTTRTYRTSGRNADTRIPLAILIDESTASASEIVAGALQDLDRAIVVGERSFGKGLVQSTRSLPYGSLLKVTTAKYYIPSGRLIQALDYSHRNEDGTAYRTPDSLTHLFSTRAGRPVRDGGGITPDTIATFPEGNRLLYNLVRDNWIFDYANRYYAAHDTVAPPSHWQLTDTVFADFKAGIDPTRFEYDRLCEYILTQLRQAAEAEGYMTEEAEAQFAALDTLLHHNLDRDLDLNRSKIEPYLAGEIQERYHSRAGRLEAGLRYDPSFRLAAAILNDPELYRSILTPRK